MTLTVEQIEKLNEHLSNLRHDINNNLSLILAATELIKHKPQTLERMAGTLSEQPPKISTALARFSADFEKAVGITR